MNNGGPAFPTAQTIYPDDSFEPPEHGMSLRDYFASLAMQAFITSSLQDQDNTKAFTQIQKQTDLNAPGMAARMSYNMADAMLEERKKDNH